VQGRSRQSMISVLQLAALALIAPRGAQAQDEKELGWFFTSEFAAVTTAGNAESITFGLGTKLRGVWPRAELRVAAGALHAESGMRTRRAVGTTSNFVVEDETIRETTAENFYARSRLDYQVTPVFTVFGGVDWLRNTFSGIDSRFLVAAGAGNVWADKERVRFKTDYGITYTFQEDVVSNPFIKSNFPGLRFAYELFVDVTSSTDFESGLVTDWNLDNTDDVRIGWTNALPVSISSRLALKPSLELNWRNDPSLTEVELFAPSGTPLGSTVLVPLRKLDSILTIALVVKI